MKQSNSKTSFQKPSNFGMGNGGKEPINVTFRNVAFYIALELVKGYEVCSD